jgi:uncharacterized protein
VAKPQSIRILIDGYNIAFGSLGTPDPKDGKGALRIVRQRLLDLLTTHLPDEVRRRTWVVFDSDADAALPTGPSAEERYQGLTIRFSRGYNSADELMTELVRGHSSPRQLTVVTSDHQIQRVAQARGAQWFDCADWIERELPKYDRQDSRPVSPTSDDDAEKTDLPDMDRDSWLKHFGL